MKKICHYDLIKGYEKIKNKGGKTMYKNAKDKGITLTSLVVTIVLLLILSTIAYETGKGTVENARLSAYRAEMTIMQEEVDKLEQEIRQGKLTESATEALQKAGITDAEEQSEYKYYDANALKALGIENVENGYLINISKRSVISVSGIKYKGEKYYTIADVPGGKYIVEKQEIESSVTFNATSDVQGDRMKIVVSNITYTGDVKKGSIYYRHENDEAGKWIRVTNETTDTSYTIEVLKEGTYQVKVVPTTDKEEKNVVPVEVPVYLANYVIAETGIKYVTLADAINSATSGQTITQTRNCADSSEARKLVNAATSSGLPKRPSGISFFNSASSNSLVMSVAMKPGAMALTVTLRAATSCAKALVAPIRAALAAE